MTDEHYPRLKTYEIAPEALMLNLRDGTAIRVIDGIPKDAELYAAGYDHQKGVFYLSVEHESFDPVSPDDRIPEGVVEMEDISDHRLLDAEPTEQ